MTDQIDLSRVTFQNSPNVSAWPATIELQGVEFKPGTPSDGNCGVRPIFNRAAVNDRWPDVRVWTHNPETGLPNAPNDGWIQFTLWAFVMVAGRWHGAALHEFWSDRHGKARVWTGAPILTQWSDWVYRNQWGPEMQSYKPQVGHLMGFMLTAGDRRSPHNLGDVRERTNVIQVLLQESAIARPFVAFNETDPPQPVPVPVPAPQPVEDWKASALELTRAVDTLIARVQAAEDMVGAARSDLANADARIVALTRQVEALERTRPTKAVFRVSPRDVLANREIVAGLQ